MSSRYDYRSEWWSAYPTVSFGSAVTEERLAVLILAGRKRATVWNGEHPNETARGMRWTVTVAGRPVAVIETVSVDRRAFHEINEDFAFEEGEGDRSLAFWRAVHEVHFRNEGIFAMDMVLWCEQFRLVAVLDGELLSKSEAHVAAEEAEARAVVGLSGESD